MRANFVSTFTTCVNISFRSTTFETLISSTEVLNTTLKKYIKLNKTFLDAFYFANVQIKTKCKDFRPPCSKLLRGIRLFLLICNNDSCTIPRKIDENTKWNIIWLNQSGLVQFFFAKTNKQYNFNFCRYIYYLGAVHKLRQVFFEDFRPPLPHLSDEVRFGGPP